MSLCESCGQKLSQDDKGLFKKLINYAATPVLCKACLAVKFNCETEQMDSIIRRFKDSGCTLFCRTGSEFIND